MGEFSVDTNKINNIADLLENQAKDLEKAADSIDSIKNRLSIEGSARAQIRSAMKTTSAQVRVKASTTAQIGQILRNIAETYRSTENRIAGYLQSGNGTYSGSNEGNRGNNHPDGAQNGGDQSSSVHSSEPVNLNTGNFILDNHDMEISGFQPLQFRRFYNSMGTFIGMLGKDWNNSFEMKIFPVSTHSRANAEVCVMLEDGKEEYFASVNGKTYIPVSNSTAELIRKEEGYVYQTLEGGSYHFDESGKYVRFENAHKIGFSLLYHANGVLEKVKKDTGECFIFSYNEQGLLKTIQDHTGRSCHYIFEDDHLKEVILPDGNSYQYFHNSMGKICRVINPRKVEAVENVYDDLHRITYQRLSDGTTNSFEYHDAEQAVIMTERNGSQSIHYHDEKYRNVRNVYADGEEYFEYNERGQKIRVTDKLGNITQLQYDNRGNVTNILMPDKTKVSMTYNYQNKLLSLSINGKMKVQNRYNTFGDLISTEDGLGRKTVYTYDEHGRRTGMEMPDKTKICAEYDARGNLSVLKDANGAVSYFVYDALNRLVQRTNALGQTNSYQYDAADRVLSETRADGHTKSYAYDEWGNVVSVKDFDGSVKTGIYNGNNQLISATDPVGRTICFEYDSMWNVAKIILPTGGVLQSVYNADNRLEMVCDAEGNKTHYIYDAMGNILTETNAEGAQTCYEWDAGRRCIRKIDADGVFVEYAYDEESRIIYFKDAEGNELFRRYDNAGQLIEEKNSLGQKRSYAYDEAGNLICLIDENGRVTSYRYARGLNKIAEVIHPNQTKEQYTYDLLGNLESYTDIYGTTLFCQYDELNRLIAATGTNGLRIEYGYDLLNRIIWKKDFEGNTTEYEYSEAGDLLAVKDALGNVTSYSYDGIGELIQILKEVPGVGTQVYARYERNLMGQITKLEDALGHTETYRYNALGKLSEKVDRDQYVTRYFYNALGLLHRQEWADGKEAVYQYDSMRRLNEICDWTGKTKVSYNEFGRLQQVLYPDERALTYTYDSFGNQTQLEYPDGSQVFCAYDSLGRLERIVQNGQEITYSYNPLGEIASRSLPNGSQVQYQYHADGMLAKMVHTDAQGILEDFSFGYDAFGRKKKYEVYRRDLPEENGVYDYTYDAAGHLSQVQKDGNLLRSYEYDCFGNRSSMTEFVPHLPQPEKTAYEYDLRGGLMKMCKGNLTEEYQYDARGNLTKHFRNGEISRQYHYDAFNRLAKVQSADGNQAVYQYNGLGYRVGMQEFRNGQEKSISYVTDYSRIYDNLLEKKENGETETYIWGNGLEGYTAENRERGWYFTDFLGSILRRMDRYSTRYAANYDEFGNMLSKKQHDEEVFGYNGFLFDVAAGTYFAQARQYRSETGTFDAMDRFSGNTIVPDSLNPYVYCLQDPLNYIDKSGNVAVAAVAVAAIAGAVSNVAALFITDLISGKFSNPGQYVVSFVSGACGGVANVFGGPIVGGAVSGFVESVLTNIFKTDGEENKTGGQIAGEIIFSTGVGAILGAITDGFEKLFKKIGVKKFIENLIGKLDDGGKASKMFESFFNVINENEFLKKLWGEINGWPIVISLNTLLFDPIKEWLLKLLGYQNNQTVCPAAA